MTALSAYVVEWETQALVDRELRAAGADEALQRAEEDGGPLSDTLLLADGSAGHLGEWQPDGDPHQDASGHWTLTWRTTMTVRHVVFAADAEAALQISEALAEPPADAVRLNDSTEAHYGHGGWQQCLPGVPEPS